MTHTVSSQARTMQDGTTAGGSNQPGKQKWAIGDEGLRRKVGKGNLRSLRPIHSKIRGLNRLNQRKSEGDGS